MPAMYSDFVKIEGDAHDPLRGRGFGKSLAIMYESFAHSPGHQCMPPTVRPFVMAGAFADPVDGARPGSHRGRRGIRGLR